MMPRKTDTEEKQAIALMRRIASALESMAQSQHEQSETVRQIAQGLAPKGRPRVVSVSRADYGPQSQREEDGQTEVPGFRRSPLPRTGQAK